VLSAWNTFTRLWLGLGQRFKKKLLELIIAKKMKRENFVNIIKTSLLLFVFLLKGKN